MTRGAFEHRGFMLDVCRHYMPVEEIRKLLDAAAALNLNRMHWHLTDDQGCRIEIRKYPKLTETGAFRGDSVFGGTPVGERNCGFYTQEEIRDIVRYAGSLGIEMIPEIEIPGHAAAMLAAYPELGCRRGETDRWEEKVETSGGIFHALVCAGKAETLDFLKDVLQEVTALFPFPAVHIGGDEALKIRWRRCPDCRKRMRELGLPSEDALQRWLVLETGAYLASLGRKTIVWNDVLEGGMLPSHFIVQQWLGGEELTRAFMQQGGEVICSDLQVYYMDYPYGHTDVRKMWACSRVPAWAEGLEDRLLGLECPLWTERISSLRRASFLLFPRLAAAAVKAEEAGTVPWEQFLERVREKNEAVRRLGLESAPEEYWDMPEEAAAADRTKEEAILNAPETEPFLRKGNTLGLLDRAERFMAAIGIPEDLTREAGDRILAELDGQEAADDGTTLLARQIMEAVDSRTYGPWWRMPEEIWLATMKCYPRFIAEYRRSYGKNGFDRAYWTVRQAGCRLFRIGELEYELTEEAGEKKLGLHIPSDAKLEPALLNDSLRKAREFMKKYYPGMEKAEIFCESWLLSPSLREMLPAGSRILRFQQAFDIRRVFPEDDTALEWVFSVAEGQREGLDLKTLPEKTSLQRTMKAKLLAGQRPGSAEGVLKGDFPE